MFLAMRHSAELETHNIVGNWLILELFFIYMFFFHLRLKGYFICELCANTLLITVKQEKNKHFYVHEKDIHQATHPSRGILVLFNHDKTVYTN